MTELPFVLTAHEQRYLPAQVLRILEQHLGKANAIRGQELARLCGFNDDRKIRLAVRELIQEGHAVAASVSDPMGFYLVANEHEARKYIDVLRSRADEDLARLRDFEAAAERCFSLPQQGALI